MNDIPFHRKPVAIAAAVVLLHVGGLAALQSGLLVRAYEVIVPVEMISQIIEPPKPEIAPPPPPPPPPPPVRPPPSPAPPKPILLPPAPQPLPINSSTPAPNAPIVTPSPAAPLPPISAPVAASPAPPAPAAPAPVAAAPPAPKNEEPIVEADYGADTSRYKRHRLSEQFGEYGVVIVQVLVGADGVVKNARIAKSSGFVRLDETALRGAKLTRFRPATRNGIPIEREYPLRVIYEEIK